MDVEGKDNPAAHFGGSSEGRRTPAAPAVSIKAVCEDLVQRLAASPVLKKRLFEVFDAQVISYAAWFAGVNAISVGLRHLTVALQSIGVHTTFRCVYAVETDGKAQAFMMSMQECDIPALIFSDARDLVERHKGWDVRSCAWLPIPDVPVLIAGCDCGTLSQLSVSRKRQRDCLTSGAGHTGQSFRLLCHFAARHRHIIKLILLENVTAIAAPDKTAYNPIEDLRKIMDEAGYNLAYYSSFAATDFGHCQSRIRFYGALTAKSVNGDDTIWATCARTLMSKEQTTLVDHLLPAERTRHHLWLSSDMQRQGMKPRDGPKEREKAQEHYQVAGLPYPPPHLTELTMEEKVASLRTPASLQIETHFLDIRENAMLFYKIAVESVLQTGIEQHMPVLLPVEKSWDYFRAVHNSCPTLCAGSKLVVACFHEHPPALRPLLPAEYFSLQGMPLAELLPHMPCPETTLSSFLAFSDVRRLCGNAFHLPSCLAALLSAMVAMDRV